MAESIRERILQAIFNALDGPGKPAGLKVTRSRRQAIEKDELPLMSVELGDTENTVPGENRRAPLLESQTDVLVISRVLGLDTALDPLYRWARLAIMADPSLGGLALGITEVSSRVDTDDTPDADRTVETTIFRVRYVTSRFDAEKQQ
jgi:hypothetical protein